MMDALFNCLFIPKSLLVHEILYCSFMAKRRFVAIAVFLFLEI